MTAHRGWIDNTRGPLDVDWPEEVSGAESDRAMSLTFANERAAATVAQTDPRTAVSRYLNGWTRDSRVAGALSPNAAAITTAAYTVPDTTIIKDIARWSTTYEASWVDHHQGHRALVDHL